MFYYLNGTVTLIDANLAVIDCGGVGYACHTTNYSLSSLQVGKTAKLYTYCNIREDAFDIFGFSSREERDYFEKLLGVSGVGPKAALAILSAVTPQQFAMAVLTQDDKMLTMAQGIGKKLAQRILLELHDKLGTAASDGAIRVGDIQPMSGGKLSEATAALVSLGYSQSEIGTALKNISVQDHSVEEIVKLALKAMVMK